MKLQSSWVTLGHALAVITKVYNDGITDGLSFWELTIYQYLYTYVLMYLRTIVLR